jgi:hypothetical protein
MSDPVFKPTGLRSLELAGSHFYLRDGLMEVWLALVVDELDRVPPHDRAPWMARMREDLHYQATIVFDGLLAARLDRHLDDEGKLRWFETLCRKLRSDLDAGAFTPGPFAARVGAGRWDEAMPQRLTRVTDAVLWLTSGSGEPNAVAPESE